MCPWVGPHAPSFGRQLWGLPSRVGYLSPQGVLLPLVYRIGTTPHSRLFKFRSQFQVHLDQFFTREGGQQGAEHLLIGYQQFLQSRGHAFRGG